MLRTWPIERSERPAPRIWISQATNGDDSSSPPASRTSLRIAVIGLSIGRRKVFVYNGFESVHMRSSVHMSTIGPVGQFAT